MDIISIAKIRCIKTYGSDAPEIQALWLENKSYGELLHPSSKLTKGEVIWAVRHEMARTIEDFLSRRSRMLLLNAQTSLEMAPTVAKLMAKELGENKKWVSDQLNKFNKLAQTYVMH